MRLSLICPAYNRPALLRRLLDSLKRQSGDFEIAILNDNSPNPEVERVAMEYLSDYQVSGFYRKSNVSNGDRLKLTRPAVCVNEMYPLLMGDIVGYTCDDHEYVDGAIESALRFFGENPRVNCGYIGCVYRFVDFRTGELVDIPPMARYHPTWMNYGGVLHAVFTLLDSCQFFHRYEYGVEWDTHPSKWLGTDAHAMEEILVRSGGCCYPINHPENTAMVISNLNEASLTVTQSPERSVEILK